MILNDDVVLRLVRFGDPRPGISGNKPTQSQLLLSRNDFIVKRTEGGKQTKIIVAGNGQALHRRAFQKSVNKIDIVISGSNPHLRGEFDGSGGATLQFLKPFFRNVRRPDRLRLVIKENLLLAAPQDPV